MIGTRLAHYEITGHLGTGGMGEVYQATDSQLGRSVAIKLLPEEFTHDTERVARFEREARVLAALNHSNIAALYGVDESGGRKFLVMELAAGDTLAERIKRGPIPVEESLAIAKQIADALEAAHEKGIVHRDLKPANIKLSADGKVKVIDFGLAKAFEAERADTILSNSPTLSMGATLPGVILGTAAYMSPEQARGKRVDKRADIWAFGVVLYEMLTGRAVFAGEDVSSTLAKVIEAEPSWQGIPSKFQRLLKKCLEKDPRKRLRDIGDVWELLGEDVAGVQAASQTVGARRSLWPVIAIGLGLLLAVLAVVHFREKAPVVEMVRFEFPAGNSVTGGGGNPVVSPDGKRVAFIAAGPSGRDQVWVHSFVSNESKPLPGTEGASSRPIWSPDSRLLAYTTDGFQLRQIDPAGGPPQTVTNPSGIIRGATWGRDANGVGVIILSVSGANGPGEGLELMRVTEAGGAALPLTLLDPSRNERAHSAPQFLPDGRHFLYTRSSSREENSGTYIGSLDAKPDQQSRERLLATNLGSAYAPSLDGRGGYVLFMRAGAIMAQPFDAAKLQLSGEAVPISESDLVTVADRPPPFTVSSTGVLVYRRGTERPGAGSLEPTQLTWFDREGKVLGTVGEPGVLTTLSISPDGTRVAFDRLRGRSGGRGPGTPNASDIFVWDFARGTDSQLTFTAGRDSIPVWSPNSSDIIFSSDRDGVPNLYRKAASGAGSEELVLKSAITKTPQDWSSNGQFLYSAPGQGGPIDLDLWSLPLTVKDDVKSYAKGKEEIYLKTDAVESQGRFSPDGAFVAYTSGAPGESEVYVKPFPDSSGGTWKVSKGGGGAQPRWRRDGKEIYYISTDSKMMAVEVSTTPEFKLGVPKVLFTAPIKGGGRSANIDRYDVTADGKKFLINAVTKTAPNATDTTPPSPITVILNWQTLLKQ